MKPINLAAAVPGLANLLSSERPEHEIWGSCIFCKAELGYGEYAVVGRKIYPRLHCKCETDRDAERRKQEEERKDREKRRLELLKTFSRHIINDSIKEAGFKNFDIRPGTEKTVEKVKSFYREFSSRKLGLLLFGTPGNGKSHLARAAQRSLDGDGWATLFLDWPQLVEIAKATFNRRPADGEQRAASVDGIVRAAINADLIVLDEIGAGDLTDWEFKTLLFPIINGRQGKKTIYTTNLDPDRLERWFAQDKNGKPLDEDGRCIDRILGNCEIIKNNGTSKRREDAMRRIQE